MTVPSQPGFFKRVWASLGTFLAIPEEPGEKGRASQKLGFPEETQLPMNLGGVAPNRMDFNGIFNMLTAFAFYAQSGGVFNWSDGLGYGPPAIINHGGKLWWCLAANGPDTDRGVAEPGTDGDVWQELLLALAGSSGGGSGDLTAVFGGNPVGTVIAYWGASAPDGYLACDGSEFSPSTYPRLYERLGMAKAPDLRGVFLRGVGGNAAPLGTKQEDAGRNITGGFAGGDDMAFNVQYGAFMSTRAAGNSVGGHSPEKWVDIDASRVWGEEHTADEFRPLNVAILYCIKHD
jgi:hypothetical protein